MGGAASMMTCYIHVVPDTNRAWVSRESPRGVSVISFWYNPSSAMTMRDVVNTIESSLGPMRIGHVIVRGLAIDRQDLDNYTAGEHLKDGETFTCHLVPICCTML